MSEIIVQGSDAWFAERAGCATASRASDILAKIKTGEALTRRKYRIQVCTERLTGIPVQGYKSAAMQWGTDTEPMARLAYEARTGSLVIQTGFIKHTTIPFCGASPDGLLDNDGLIEIKCPESTTHITWLEEGRVPPEHLPQLNFQMWVTGRSYVDFVSYDPRFPPNLQLMIVRTKRDDAFIATLAAEVKQFLLECDQLVEKLKGMK